jgi:hypothetical protein
MTEPTKTNTVVKPTTKAPRGEGHTITLDLKDHPELLTDIKAAAKADDREPSKFLRRIIALLHIDGKLLPKK